MDRANRLLNLEKLARIKKDADVAKLESLRSRLNSLESQIEKLECSSIEPQQGATFGPSAYQISGRDFLWDAWKITRIRELTKHCNHLRADIEQNKVETQRSSGKHLAIGKIIDGLDISPGRK